MVRINIGGFELDSDKLPQNGLDYSKFDYETRKALSVFDTDSRKGHLSVAELRNAISFFSSQDGVTETGKDADGNKSVTYHKKDNNIDSFEYQKTEEKFKNKTANIKLPARDVAKIYKQKHVSDFINFYQEEYYKLPSDEEINAFKKAWVALVDEINGTNPGNVFHEIYESAMKNVLATTRDGVVAVEFARRKVKDIETEVLKMKYANLNDKDMKAAIGAISSAIEADKNGLRVSDSDPDVFQDKNGKYYIRTSEGKLQRCDKKGNYNVRKTLNDKGQKSLIKYNKSGVPISIKAQNYQNKTYTNKHFAANVLRLEKNYTTCCYDDFASEEEIRQKTMLNKENEKNAKYFIDTRYCTAIFGKGKIGIYTWNEQKHSFELRAIDTEDNRNYYINDKKISLSIKN